eukprot:COSAG05_NODE_37_length_27688_cov_18.080394_29_plen_445_part_00
MRAPSVVRLDWCRLYRRRARGIASEAQFLRRMEEHGTALSLPPEGRGPDDTIWRSAASRWLEERGLAPGDFAVGLSSVQSCPAGCVTVEVNFHSADEQERSLRSRVLEIDTTTGAIGATLAARDTSAVRALVGPGTTNSDSSVDAAGIDWQAYRAGKDMLDAATKHEGAAFFAAPAEGQATGRVGLLNQGATCYMNSLLQTLFMTPLFRRYVFKWRYDPRIDPPKEQCITLQLQILFARMALGNGGAVSTKPLTAAFGWTAADAFQQHDVQELNRVLFEALGVGSSAASFEAEVGRYYTGSVSDYIQGVSWPEDGAPRRAHNEKFMDLQLVVDPALATVEESLRQYCTPERLDGDNQWQWSDNAGVPRVDALKGIVFLQFPRLLTLHLKRFVFDYATMRRRKLNDPLRFGESLDVAPVLASPLGPTTSAAESAGGGQWRWRRWW